MRVEIACCALIATAWGCLKPVQLRAVQLSAELSPRYVCGGEAQRLTWGADRDVRTVVESDRQDGRFKSELGIDVALQGEGRGRVVLYDSGTEMRAGSEVPLPPVDPDLLPLRIRAMGAGAFPLHQELIGASLEIAGVKPNEANYVTFVTPEPPPGAVDRVSKEQLRGLRLPEDDGRCAEPGAFEEWQVLVRVKGWRWSLDPLVSPSARLLGLVNTSKLDIAIGPQWVPPGGALVLPEPVLGVEVEVEGRTYPSVVYRCGVERRFEDGRCVATAGLGRCDASPGEVFQACGLEPPGLSLRLACGKSAGG